MKQAIAHNRQQDVDVAAAFLIAFGTLMFISGLLPMFLFFVDWKPGWFLIPAPYGAALMAGGFSIKRGRRHAITASMLLSGLLVVVFPIGTCLSGYLLFALWKARPAYNLRLRTVQIEKAESCKDPLQQA